MASPDLEKQGFFAVVFVNREYNEQPDPCGHAQILKPIKNLNPKKTPLDNGVLCISICCIGNDFCFFLISFFTPIIGK